MVLVVTPIVVAISSSVSPPKKRSSTTWRKPVAFARQPVECLVERQKLVALHIYCAIGVRKRHGCSTAAALGGVATPGMIDQNLSHRAGGNPQEVGPIFGADRATRELEIGLVHQGGWLQGVTLHLPPEHPVRGLPKFLVDKGKETVERFLIAAPQLVKKS
jgi:hypothetical protein